jgi:hypothetical protein
MNQMGIPAGLQAVLSAANAIKPVSSTGQPTVAAQVMGAAEQASMPQVAQDMRFAAPEVNENLEEERMQDILQRLDQSRAQPAGIEGLPAPNMQFAEGGVVGFAGEGPSLVSGYAPDYQDARRFGIDLSPYDSPEVIAQKRERVRRMREFEAQMAQNRAEIPTEASEAVNQGIARAYADPTRARDVPPVVRQISAPVAPPRAQRPGTGRPTAAPASAPVAAPAAAAAPAAGIAGLTEYDKKAAEAREEAEKRLKEPFARKAPTLEEIQAVTDKARQARGLTGAAGAHYDEQIAALKELFAQQAAERAAGASGRDRADLAAILSAGGKGGLRAVGERYAQISHTRAEEAERLRAQQVTQKQAVFTMQNAQVAMREAAAAGDMNAYRAAQQEFDAAQRAYETSKTSGILAIAKERGDVAKDMGTRSFQQQQLAQQAQIERDKMTNAIKVAQIGASSRTPATEINPYQRAQLREKAADNVRQDKNLPTIILRAKQEAAKNRVPFNEQEFVERLIERQYKILTGETPPPPAPAAGGIDPAILKQFKVTPVGG